MKNILLKTLLVAAAYSVPDLRQIQFCFISVLSSQRAGKCLSGRDVFLQEDRVCNAGYGVAPRLACLNTVMAVSTVKRVQETSKPINRIIVKAPEKKTRCTSSVTRRSPTEMSIVNRLAPFNSLPPSRADLRYAVQNGAAANHMLGEDLPPNPIN